MSALTIADIDTAVSDEPRIMDLRLAEALGFVDAHKIRDLIKRHHEVLKSYGEVSAVQRKPGREGGRPGTQFWLNRKQALFITAKSDTPASAAITVEMVEVFDAYLNSKEQRVAPATSSLPAPTLSRSGLAVLRIGSKTITVDTKRFKVGPNDRVVRLHMDGRIDIGMARIEGVPNWYGARGAAEPWHRPGRNCLIGTTRVSSTVQILGLVIDEVDTKRPQLPQGSDETSEPFGFDPQALPRDMRWQVDVRAAH